MVRKSADRYFELVSPRPYQKDHYSLQALYEESNQADLQRKMGAPGKQRQQLYQDFPQLWFIIDHGCSTPTTTVFPHDDASIISHSSNALNEAFSIAQISLSPTTTTTTTTTAANSGTTTTTSSSSGVASLSKPSSAMKMGDVALVTLWLNHNMLFLYLLLMLLLFIIIVNNMTMMIIYQNNLITIMPSVLIIIKVNYASIHQCII